MNEHQPECWANHESDPPAWCICDEIRSCEKRVLNAAHAVDCDVSVYASDEGQWVTYAEHAAEIRACEERAREEQCSTCCTSAEQQYATEFNSGREQGYNEGYSAAMDHGRGGANNEPTPGPVRKIDRWGASGRTGLPDTMPNGEWVKYKDHIEAINAITGKGVQA